VSFSSNEQYGFFCFCFVVVKTQSVFISLFGLACQKRFEAIISFVVSSIFVCCCYCCWCWCWKGWNNCGQTVNDQWELKHKRNITLDFFINCHRCDAIFRTSNFQIEKILQFIFGEKLKKKLNLLKSEKVKKNWTLPFEINDLLFIYFWIELLEMDKFNWTIRIKIEKNQQNSFVL
jgi:hypothetical protein